MYTYKLYSTYMYIIDPMYTFILPNTCTCMYTCKLPNMVWILLISCYSYLELYEWISCINFSPIHWYFSSTMNVLH